MSDLRYDVEDDGFVLVIRPHRVQRQPRAAGAFVLGVGVSVSRSGLSPSGAPKNRDFNYPYPQVAHATFRASP